jgi:hypothetical protein
MANDAKIRLVEEIIEGKAQTGRPVEVYIRGSALGFPAVLQAVRSHWPFGLTYIIETNVIEEEAAPGEASFSLSLMPRIARGPFNWATRFLFLETVGMSIDDKRIQGRFVVAGHGKEQVERFLSYPGVFDRISQLETMTKFTELIVKSDAGLALSQPKSFNDVSLDICRETFKHLANLGQVLFESF